EDIGPRRDDGCTQQNKDQAEDQRKNNTDQQHLLLVLTRDLKRTHNQGEDKEVIDRQRLFCHITRVVLQRVLLVPQTPDQQAEDQRKNNTDQQNLLLVLTRDLKRTHNQGEDKEVIDRQRLFCHITRVVLQRVLLVPQTPDQQAEEQRDGYVKRSPRS